jgi:hypothetical protein
MLHSPFRRVSSTKSLAQIFSNPALTPATSKLAYSVEEKKYGKRVEYIIFCLSCCVKKFFAIGAL